MQTLQPNEEREYIKGMRDVCHEKSQFAESRNGQIADQFTNLEVQIAAILFAFMGFFSNFITGVDSKLYTFPELTVIFIKMSFATIFFCLILSLIFGLIHLKMKEFFWNDLMGHRVCRFYKWNEAYNNQCSCAEASAFHNGNTGGNMSGITHSPKWTWILQTIFLGISVILLFVILMIFLFS